MYSPLSYGAMVAPSLRTDAYVAALRAAVRPGCSVLDVGCGFGFFAVLAAKLGAAPVYGVETSEFVHLARELAKENGVSDRTTFVRGRVEDLVVDHPFDIVIGDLRGPLPFLTGNIPAMAAARRLLAPSGVLIPQRDVLFAAPSDDAHAFSEWSSPWLEAPGGVSLLSMRQFATNEWSKGSVTAASLLAPGQTWASLDYRRAVAAPVAGELSFVAQRAGTLRGFVVWFDAELAPNIGFSNAPGLPAQVYERALFPVASTTVVERGSRVDFAIKVTPVADDHDWSWRVHATAPDGSVLLDERHHSMLARPLRALANAISNPDGD